MKKKLLIMILAAVMLLAGCAKETVEVPELLVPVGASLNRTTVVRGDIEDAEIYTASVAPRYTALYFTEDTTVATLGISLGSPVQAGDVLVASDISQIQRSIGALDSEAAQITADSEYYTSLHTIDMELYALNMDDAKTEDERYDIETEMMLYDLEYSNAESARNERLADIAEERAVLEAQLDGSVITSPSNGHVTYLGCSAGQTAGAYDTVCVVTDTDSPVIQSDYISAGKLANAVEIYALVGDTRYEVVAEPVDEDDYTNSMLRGGEYLSVFTLPEGTELEIGQSAVVCVVTMRVTDVLKLPVNAVFQEDGEYYVYLVEGETRTRQAVTIGAESPTEYEITYGLEEGDVVYVGD